VRIIRAPVLESQAYTTVLLHFLLVLVMDLSIRRLHRISRLFRKLTRLYIAEWRDILVNDELAKIYKLVIVP
jgi:hypothetical protein